MDIDPNPDFGALAEAAEALLEARKNNMQTIEEWAGLAMAVAACHGRPAADYLSENDLEAAAAAGVDLNWDMNN